MSRVAMSVAGSLVAMSGSRVAMSVAGLISLLLLYLYGISVVFC